MRLLFLALAIGILASCTDHMKVPSDIIPKEKMETVFWDMIQADRYTSNFLRKNGDTAAAKKATFELYEQVFRIHGITEKEFKKSYVFYMSRPDIAYVMFDSITAKTDDRRKAIYTAMAKKDSIHLKNKRDSAKAKGILDMNNKPGTVMNRRDSAIRAQLLKSRKDSAFRAHEITRRKDSALKVNLLAHKRDSLVKLRLLNKKKNAADSSSGKPKAAEKKP